jgi:hypothetical protein
LANERKIGELPGLTARRKIADAVARQIFRATSYLVVAVFGGIFA